MNEWQVPEFGGDRPLRDVLPELRDLGYAAVECLVMTAWKINQNDKEFTRLLQARNPSLLLCACTSQAPCAQAKNLRV